MQQPRFSQEQCAAPALLAPGDECGQLAANLALALFTCHLRDQAMTRSYIAQALANATRLSHQGRTIRAAGPMKMAQVVFEGLGLTETIMLPMLDDVLLLPSPDTNGAARMLQMTSARPMITTCLDVSITYHHHRIRTARIRQELSAIIGMDASALAGNQIQDILMQCLYPAMPSVNALDRADDYLTLALNFARLGNYPLAATSLAQARYALRAFESQPNTAICPGRMDATWASLANLEHALASMAS